MEFDVVLDLDLYVSSLEAGDISACLEIEQKYGLSEFPPKVVLMGLRAIDGNNDGSCVKGIVGTEILYSTSTIETMCEGLGGLHLGKDVQFFRVVKGDNRSHLGARGWIQVDALGKASEVLKSFVKADDNGPTELWKGVDKHEDPLFLS